MTAMRQGFAAVLALAVVWMQALAASAVQPTHTQK